MPKYKSFLYPNEWEIMNIVWSKPEKISVREVLEKGYPDGEKAYTTVQTVMNVLVDKGFLKKEKIGMVNFYEPLVSKKESVQKETTGFIDKVFNGSMHEMANFLFGTESLDEEEVKIVKKLIKEKENELREKKK